jgi:hypothetical protein
MTVMTSHDAPVRLSAIASAQGKSGGDPPDLTLSSGDIGFTPSEPAVGETVTITANVHNIGDANAKDVLVHFYANSTFIGEDGIPVIPRGQSRSADIDWIPGVAGNYTILVVVDPENTIAEANEVNNKASKTITVLEKAPPPPPPAIEYELFIEIDYMEGHEPTATVLTYIHSYYYERGVNVTFYVNDTVPYDSSVTDAEFWAIEAEYNNMGDDSAGGDPNAGVYFSKWKWVLYGTTVDGEPNVVGYTWVVLEGFIKLDCLAGNYIFIADETADGWALSNGIEPYGAEATVLMHELGHSVGIGDFHRFRGEIYCDDPYCVMALLSVYNAGNYGAWYYCDDHWATKNLEYYTI